MGDAVRPVWYRRIVQPMPFLVLGEALVGLICEQPADGIADADAFVPHFGGAAANVAVNAARAGGTVALAGGAGQDGARVISTVGAGAGDAFLGTLLSRLQAMDWDPAVDRPRDALADAAEAGARATESWGAVA